MKMEAQNIAQRRGFFLCVKLGDSTTTTYGKLQQAFGDDAMSRAQAFHWHNLFSEDRTLVEEEQRSGRPSAPRTGDNTARVRELVRIDRRLTVRMIADEVNMNRETVRLILTEKLGMRKMCAKMGPRNLTQQQQDARLNAVFDIQLHYGEAAADSHIPCRSPAMPRICLSESGLSRPRQGRGRVAAWERHGVCE
jgi:hypothetical protein